MNRRLPIVVLAALLATVAVPQAQAVTPTQNAIAGSKIRFEIEKRRKLAIRAKQTATLQARQKADGQIKTKSVLQSRINVHDESKRRLEATRKAAALHARIVEAQLETAHKGDRRGGSGRAGSTPRHPLHRAASVATPKAVKATSQPSR